MLHYLQYGNSCWVYSNNGRVRGAGVGTAGTCIQPAQLPASVIILSSSGAAAAGAGKLFQQAVQDLSKDDISSFLDALKLPCTTSTQAQVQRLTLKLQNF